MEKNLDAATVLACLVKMKIKKIRSLYDSTLIEAKKIIAASTKAIYKRLKLNRKWHIVMSYLNINDRIKVMKCLLNQDKGYKDVLNGRELLVK